MGPKWDTSEEMFFRFKKKNRKNSNVSNVRELSHVKLVIIRLHMRLP